MSIEFFKQNAGFSYDPKTQTAEQGKQECAEQLAAAENTLLDSIRVSDVSVVWGDDPRGFSDYYADKRAGLLAPGIKKPRDIQYCAILIDGRCVASLHGIWDASPEYRRVIRAELAHECIDDLKFAIGNAG